MSKKLATHVVVNGETYEAGTAEGDLPDGVADAITNPKAWTGPNDDEVVSANSGTTASVEAQGGDAAAAQPAKKAAAKKASGSSS